MINVKKSDLVPSQTAKYHPYRGRLGFPSLTRVGRFLSVAERFLYYDPSSGSALAGGPGSPGIARAPGPSLSPSDLFSAVASPGALVPRDGISLSSGALVSGSEAGSVLVDGEGPSFDRFSIRNSYSGSAPLFGRVLLRVRRPPPRTSRVRSVVGHVQLLYIILLKMKTLSLALRAFREVVVAHTTNSDMRQLDGRGVYHLAMGQGFLCPMLVGLPPSEMDGGSRRPSRCEVSSRSVPCPGGFPQPSRTCCRDRVVSSPSGGEFTASCVGQPVD